MAVGKIRSPFETIALVAITFVCILILCHVTHVASGPQMPLRMAFIGGFAGLVAGLVRGWSGGQLVLKVALQSAAGVLAGLAYLATI